jgi:hypothetical protein
VGSSLVTVALLSVMALALVGLAAWRPASACAVLALLVPLTAGIARNTVVPFFRPSEALSLVVVVGLFINILLLRRRLAYVGLDLIVLAFVLIEVLIPFLMLFVRQAQVGLDTWRTVLGPFQYFAVYVVFSRCEPTPASLRWIINLTFVASIIVAAVAVAEVLSPGFHSIVSRYYEESPTAINDPVYRPSSLVTHYSAVAGFAILVGSLAVSLLVVRVRGFPVPWLGFVVIANTCGLIVSQTWAPLVALPVVGAAIFLHARRIPWRPLLVLGGLTAASVLLFWPQISDRINQQQVFSSGGGFAVTLDTRLRYWQEFFIPAALDNFWFGTGTSTVAGGYPTPSSVPERLTKFIDNEYLYEVLRAGVFALIMLLVVFAALAREAWHARASSDPWTRAIGAAVLASVVTVVISGLTSEYLTFSALTQLFWMQIGLLVAMGMGKQTVAPAIAPARSGRPSWRLRGAPILGA